MKKGQKKGDLVNAIAAALQAKSSNLDNPLIRCPATQPCSSQTAGIPRKKQRTGMTSPLPSQLYEDIIAYQPQVHVTRLEDTPELRPQSQPEKETSPVPLNPPPPPEKENPEPEAMDMSQPEPTVRERRLKFIFRKGEEGWRLRQLTEAQQESRTTAQLSAAEDDNPRSSITNSDSDDEDSENEDDAGGEDEVDEDDEMVGDSQVPSGNDSDNGSNADAHVDETEDRDSMDDNADITENPRKEKEEAMTENKDQRSKISPSEVSVMEKTYDDIIAYQPQVQIIRLAVADSPELQSQANDNITANQPLVKLTRLEDTPELRRQTQAIKEAAVVAIRKRRTRPGLTDLVCTFCPPGSYRAPNPYTHSIHMKYVDGSG